MKTIRKLFPVMLAAAAFVIVITSCTDDDEPPPVSEIPVITTADISDIAAVSAKGGGNITTDGGASVTARGVCWNTSPNPTTAQHKTADGTGAGSFTSNITGLSPNTQYYVRAYATNSVGTAYGQQRIFTTGGETPADITDADGNTYRVIQIGTQTWMAENLKVTKYKDGTLIPEVQTQATYDPVGWAWLTTTAWSYHGNDPANNTQFGKLYNWYAVQSGKLAPEGWHVPTREEWDILFNHLGGEMTAGGKLKATTTWKSPNTGATDSENFSAYGAGSRSSSGLSPTGFDEWTMYTGFWTATPSEGNSAYFILLSYLSEAAFQNKSPAQGGYYIRCVKD